MSKHTKGEWWIGAIEGKDFDRRPIFSREGMVDTRVAEVIWTGEARDTDANARLISAAPDLLEALKLADRIIANGGGCNGEQLEIISAAISKATGNV